MNKSEIIKVITSIKIQCSDALPVKNDQELDLIVSMWHEEFKPYPSEVVWHATRKALTNTDYQKKNWLAAIMAEIHNMIQAVEPSDNDLWFSLNEALAEVRDIQSFATKGRYDLNKNVILRLPKETARKELLRVYNDMHKYLREYCNNVDYLLKLSEASDYELNIEKGRFFKALPEIRNRQKILLAMPHEVKSLLGNTKDGVKLLTSTEVKV